MHANKIKVVTDPKLQLSPFLRMALMGFLFAGPAPAKKPGAADDDGADAAAGKSKNTPHEQDTIEDLQAKMVEVHERGNVIRAAADQGQRKFTEDEQKELNELDAEFEALDAEVNLRERIVAQRERLATPVKRLTRAEEEDETPRQRVTGGDLVGVTKGSGGFRSMGEYAMAVIRAAGGQIDKRLSAAATTFGSEGSNTDGGFAVPPDFRETIVKKVQAEDGLLARTDQQFTSGNKLTVPQDNTTPWQNSGGVQVYWDSEAATYTQSKPALEQLEVKANKATCLVPITDELLEDVPALSRYLPNKVGDKFTSKINDAIVNGDGVGKPQGLLNSTSKITVTKEGGQAAATFVYANAVKMWSRMLATLRQGAIWLMNQDLEPQLQQMVMPGATPAFPVYLPPGGLSQAPYGTLFGRPLVAVEACQTLGTEGDIMLVNLSQYLTVQKVGGLRSDVSMHCYFEQSMQAFRFIMRIGGQSWWKSAVSRQNGSNTLSNIISLQAR